MAYINGRRISLRQKFAFPVLRTWELTLDTDDWETDEEGYFITAQAEEMTSDKIVILSPAPSLEVMEAYSNNKIFCSEQGDGTLTFRASSLPSVDIDVNVAEIGGIVIDN